MSNAIVVKAMVSGIRAAAIGQGCGHEDGGGIF